MLEPDSRTTEHPVPERFNSPEYRNVIDAEAAGVVCRIHAPAIRAMAEAAGQRYPHEACGLLIGRADAEGWLVDEAREVPNLNTERAADRFILDPAAYQRVDAELRGSGREIVGIWHSHPDCPARPSPTDLANAWEGFAYVIVSVHDGRPSGLECWALNGTGKRFQHVVIREMQA